MGWGGGIPFFGECRSGRTFYFFIFIYLLLFFSLEESFLDQGVRVICLSFRSPEHPREKAHTPHSGGQCLPPSRSHLLLGLSPCDQTLRPLASRGILPCTGHLHASPAKSTRFVFCGFSFPCAGAGEHRRVPFVLCSSRCCTNPGFCTAFLTQAPWRGFSVCPSSPSKEESALRMSDCQGPWSVRLVSGHSLGRTPFFLGKDSLDLDLSLAPLRHHD